jgi:hypothetical protein
MPPLPPPPQPQPWHPPPPPSQPRVRARARARLVFNTKRNLTALFVFGLVRVGVHEFLPPLDPNLRVSGTLRQTVVTNNAVNVKISGCTDLQTSLPLLVAALRDDPEKNALRPLTLHLNSTLPPLAFHFPGLSEQLLSRAFQGRRIALIGDSTLYYLIKWLFALMVDNNTNNSDIRNKTGMFTNLDLLNLTNGNTLVRKSSLNCRGNCVVLDDHSSKAKSKPIIDTKHGTHIEWMGGATGPKPNTEVLLRKAWERANVYQPEIVIVNMGLHWLHFFGKGRDANGPTIRRWVLYEEWLQESLNNALRVGAKVILFKTTNYVCDEKFRGGYATANQLYRAKDKNTLDECKKLAWNVNVGESFNLTQDNVAQYCEFGTFNEVGASFLNKRLFDFVNGLPEIAGLRFQVFNDHDVEHCRHTKPRDGRHYHESILLRIRLLGNILECMAD